MKKEISKKIKISPNFSISKLATILERIEEKVIHYINDELNLRLLSAPLEIETIFLDKDLIEIRLSIDLIVSPLIPTNDEEETLVDKVASKFFKLLEHEISEKNDTHYNAKLYRIFGENDTF